MFEVWIIERKKNPETGKETEAARVKRFPNSYELAQGLEGIVFDTLENNPNSLKNTIKIKVKGIGYVENN